MAKKKATRRKRRSPEQIIEDLQRQIRDVKARAAARQLKQSPAISASLAAIKALDKALDLAAEEEQGSLRHALADARKPLGEHLTELGIKLPKARLPKGRRPKKA